MPAIMDDPLASAAIRYGVRERAVAEEPSKPDHRPLALRFARTVPNPAVPDYVYDPQQQLAVDKLGRPLFEMGKKGKDWKTKAQSDGDEGPEEDWGWEEE